MKKKFKAGALYYAIFISFFIALISGFMLLQHWYQKYYVLYVQQGERLERDLHSALLFVMENPDKFSVNQKTSLDLFEDSLNIVDITKKWWGGYQLIHAENSWRVIHKSKIFLVGTETLPKDAVALYLSDDGKYLSIAGATEIKGNCFLPKLGIRKAYIEGTGYVGDKLVQGITKESKETLPAYNVDFVENNKMANQGEITVNDSLADLQLLLQSRSLTNSFHNKTLKFNTSSWLTLENQKLSGNIKIFSQVGITVKKTAVIKDVILYAPKVEFEEDFSGSLQCFVTDTLLVGEDCIFRFPTLLALNETSIEKPLIEIGETATVLGDVVLMAISDKENVMPECRINEDVIINGTVYCAGKVNHKGTIKGQLFCKGFVLRTHSSVYENHLLNADLNSTLLSPYYSGSLYDSGNQSQKMIQCQE